MGFASAPEYPEPAADIRYVEIEIVGVRSFVGRLVRFPRNEIQAPELPKIVL